jgi:hypothetical protein
MKLSFHKDQKEKAIELGYPLCCLGIEDRHLSRKQGGKYGQICSYGPVHPDIAKKILKLITESAKKKGKLS